MSSKLELTWIGKGTRPSQDVGEDRTLLVYCMALPAAPPLPEAPDGQLRPQRPVEALPLFVRPG